MNLTNKSELVVYLNKEISLQKSCVFSTVRSCSSITLIATSVPLHIPLNTSPKEPTRSEQSHKFKFETRMGTTKLERKFQIENWFHS